VPIPGYVPGKDGLRELARNLSPASYIVFTDGSKYYAKNGSTGMIEFTDTDLGKLLNTVISVLPKTSYTEIGETVTNTPYGRIIIREGMYNVYTPVVIPPGSMISIEGCDSGAHGQTGTVGVTTLVYRGANNGKMIDVPKGGYNYPHSKIRIENLFIKWDQQLSGTAINIVGAFTTYLRGISIGGNRYAYPTYGILLNAAGQEHITVLEDIDIAGCQYAVYVNQEHIDIYGMSLTSNKYGLYVAWKGAFKRGGIRGLQLMNNNIDFYATSDGDPIFIDVLMLEHSGAPPAPPVITNGRKLVIGQLTFTPSNWNVIKYGFDNFSNVILLSDRASSHNPVTHLLVRNKGIATFSGDGTTKQFTISHGLANQPSRVSVTPASADASGSYYVTADATYIYVNYITAPPAGSNNVVLFWSAEV